MRILMKLTMQLAWRSAWARRISLAWVVLAIASSCALLLAVDWVRQSARYTFSHAVSGTDLIVGAQTSSVALLLYSVFRMGEPAREMSYDVVVNLRQDPRVKSVFPIALGDNYKGYPVLGTEAQYFQQFRYGRQQSLVFSSGRGFQNYAPGMPAAVLFEAVLGHEVARKEGLTLGASLALSHGVSLTDSVHHADKPFVVVGILAPTGTPVDRSVHISLQGMSALHVDWTAGTPMRGFQIDAEYVTKFDLSPQTVTAAMVALHSRALVFRVKRQIESNTELALSAVLPGVALASLWENIRFFESALLLMAVLVAVVSLFGVLGVMLVSLEQRKRELAILRSIGLGPLSILALLVLENVSIAVFACSLGVGLTVMAQALFESRLVGLTGIQFVPLFELSWAFWVLLFGIIFAGLLSVVPAWVAYREQLNVSISPVA